MNRQQAGSAREIVYQALREQILNLQLQPGAPLSENETSLQFQVSRTPVRESFMKLAQEGLVQVLPQRGTYVSLIDTALVEEARFMREQLECAVIKLACKHLSAEYIRQLETNLLLQEDSVRRTDEAGMFELDQQFHRILFAGCGKLNVWNAMEQLAVHMVRSRKLKLVADQNWSHLYDQHCQMVATIKAKDEEAAARLMTQHLSLSISDLEQLKTQYPEYFTV